MHDIPDIDDPLLRAIFEMREYVDELIDQEKRRVGEWAEETARDGDLAVTAEPGGQRHDGRVRDGDGPGGEEDRRRRSRESNRPPPPPERSSCLPRRIAGARDGTRTRMIPGSVSTPSRRGSMGGSAGLKGRRRTGHDGRSGGMLPVVQGPSGRETRWAWCLFRSGARPYAVRLDAVAEIVDADGLVRLPLSPPRVLGLFTLRRDVVPVLRMAEGQDDDPGGPDTKLVVLILRTEGGRLGHPGRSRHDRRGRGDSHRPRRASLGGGRAGGAEDDRAGRDDLCGRRPRVGLAGGPRDDRRLVRLPRGRSVAPGHDAAEGVGDA